MTEMRYAWHDFEQDDSTDAIPDKLILTITDDGEEMSVIVHRIEPTLDNDLLMESKRVDAQRIVDALNRSELAFSAGDDVVSHYEDEAGVWTMLELTAEDADAMEWRTVATLLLSDAEAADLARRLTDRSFE